ncbi:MAG TPA: ABC transporter ATP-binding protein/permease [Candidatus Fusicatenibacter intestinigallinarum]|uniref:ABC transporter ATP-binding protein/permease n=1 Tax=Candidatus Fusicatenibacter intestinigallinarum TaxID=2838598 RepID=A0A9D2NC92_9FIRM|nr:ABC transporter ATP-binding protein/permease [Candidatus Fusicatenibacter intestinigallinarum]
MKRRNGIQIMGSLIGLVRPLIHIMAAAVVMGVIGYLCAIFLTILAGSVLVRELLSRSGAVLQDGFLYAFSYKEILAALVILAVLRGVLHYIEQYCNHFIAFKLLAMIRHKVFAALRKLCPAKLEGRDRGNLISIITTDIELLEVFYAHTISPVAIAVLTSLAMVCFIGSYHPLPGILALAAYLIVGAALPLWNGKRGGTKGMEFRMEFGDLNSFVLDSLRGLDETIQYGQGEQRKEQMSRRSRSLGELQKDLSKMEASQRALTNLVILVSSFAMLFLALHLYRSGQTGFDTVVICTIAMMGSFGPVVALSSLSNNLNQTLASGERVLSILEEEPQVREVEDGVCTEFSGASCRHVDFAYGEETILRDYSIGFQPGQIAGIHGSSGSGKSTLLKLLMRFWDVQGGAVKISGENIRKICTGNLRDMESYVTQETYLFHDSIANNIAVGRPGASREEIMEAAKKASIHDFILSLPDGYDTKVGELGDTLSGGERQRIGIARAFLHDAPFLLLDEPTSNLDSLSEGIILRSLNETCREKTVVLVSHRASTMGIADVVYEMENGRIS